MCNKHLIKKDRRVTYNAGRNKTEIDFVLVGKDRRKYLKNVEVILAELQYGLAVAVDRRKLSSLVTRNKVLQRWMAVEVEKIVK